MGVKFCMFLMNPWCYLYTLVSKGIVQQGCDKMVKEVQWKIVSAESSDCSWQEKIFFNGLIYRMHINFNCYGGTIFWLYRVQNSQTITWCYTHFFPCRQWKCLPVEYFFFISSIPYLGSIYYSLSLCCLYIVVLLLLHSQKHLIKSYQIISCDGFKKLYVI